MKEFISSVSPKGQVTIPIEIWIESAEKHGETIPEETALPQVITIDAAA